LLDAGDANPQLGSIPERGPYLLPGVPHDDTNVAATGLSNRLHGVVEQWTPGDRE
jgi:hypothetical protein